jgi:Uncharacterised protein family (UPF0175)
MNIVVRIPDALATRLVESGLDLERQALEALALEGFRSGYLSKAELRDTLGFAAVNELDGFLKSHGVYEAYSLADLERDRATLDELGI